MAYIENMAKFKSELLNKLAKEDKSGKDRIRKPVTLYLHRQNFEKFKEAIKPLSPSQVFDAFIVETMGSEKKGKK